MKAHDASSLQSDASARHDLRIRGKKFQIAIDTFGDVFRDRRARRRRKRMSMALQPLQARLGRLNDMETRKWTLRDLAVRGDSASAFAAGAIVQREMALVWGAPEAPRIE